MAAIHRSALSVCQEALSQLRQDKVLLMEELEGGTESAVGRKCRYAYEPSRMQIILAREWNFCRRRVAVLGVPRVPGVQRPAARVPDEAMRVVAAFGPCGRKLDGWSVYGNGEIRASEPVAEIEYVVDAKDVDRWPPLVRDAFVKLLARNLAIPVTGRNADLKVADDLYREALRQAALVDARENKPGEEVWGDNVYADAIRGVAHGRHGGRHHGWRTR